MGDAMSITESERKLIQIETLLEVVKALATVGPTAGFVGHHFGTLAGQLTNQIEELTKEVRRLAQR